MDGSGNMSNFDRTEDETHKSPNESHFKEQNGLRNLNRKKMVALSWTVAPVLQGNKWYSRVVNKVNPT